MNLSSLTSSVKSVQRGIFIPGATSGNITLSPAVNTAKAVVIGHGNGNDAVGVGYMTLDLTSATNLAWSIASFSSSSKISWQVLEFN